MCKEAASAFDIRGDVLDVRPLGCGLINDSYRVYTDGPDDYVLQRINTAIFSDVELLQHNIECVTEHIRSKGGTTLRFLPCKATGKSYWSDGASCWRLSVFIPDSHSYDSVNPEHACCAGRAFGHFEALLADLPEPLGETIPDFHNMELRASQLHEACRADAAGRMAEPAVQDILRQLLPFEKEMCKAERLYREGALPKRICHCDSKVNNILFDRQGEILCVVDLDTVMPAFVFSDFGDFLRTAANTLAEDDPDTGAVDFRMDIFESFARGYLESAHGFLTPVELENLPYAACLFPYMQAVRFFTDYINGDSYYKIQYPQHNLVRTRNQLALFQACGRRQEEMKIIVENLIKFIANR